MEFRYYTHHPMVDYANSMDPGAYDKGPQKPSTSIKDIGMSVPLGISAQNVAGIYSKIRMGAGSIELAFPTQGTGNRNAHTPEMYGTDQRQAIRELANINEVKLTTHAAYNVMGMMGRDQRDNFSNTNAREGMREVERAIDFAADTAGAGSVVVHTGEWERPLTEMYLDDPTTKTNLAYDDEGRLMFKRTQQQVFDAQFTLLDDRTSQKMETAQKDRKISIPIWNRADRDYDGKYQEDIHVMHDKEKWMEKYVGKPAHIKKGDYIDYEGRKIIDPYNVKYGRVPDFDPDARTFKVEYQNWNYFIKEAQEQTNFNKAHWKDKTNKDWRDDPMWYYDGERHPDEAFMHATLETNEGHSRGWAIQFAIDSKNDLELLKKYEEARKYYQQLDKEIPEEEKWKLMRNKEFGDLIPPESKHPLELIEERLNQVRARLTYAKESSASQLQQAEDTAETKEHIVTPSKRFKLHAARFYAEAGIRAMQRTKDPNTPVFIAIENIFPERFGGHPEELKFVIDQSRKWMVDFLTKERVKFGITEKGDYPNNKDGISPYYQPSLNKEEAEKLAEKYIKATFDTGHANTWRKYWQIKPGQTIEDADKEFKQWYTKEFEKLVKNGYVGNIHLTDNFGYHDDHVAPGQGNAPIREVMDILKKYKYDKAITVEPGADASTDLSDFHGLMKTWRYLGSPIYGTGAGGMARIPQSWSDVHYSYFGQSQPPMFTFGAYAPSNDWTLWSQVPME